MTKSLPILIPNTPLLAALINANIIAKDQEDNPILLVAVDFRQPHHQQDSKIIDFYQKTGNIIPFVMLVNPETIKIFQFDKKEAVFTEKASDILSFYEPEFSQKKIFQSYLVTLVEAWLSDLDYHWKLANPPGLGKVDKIGLLKLLKKGTTEIID